MTDTKGQPKWATPDRQNSLIELFLSSGGFCVYGHKPCLIPEHHYSIYIELLIRDWQQSDRDDRLALWQAEQRAMHSLGERTYPATGRFNAVSRDIYHDSQPLYYFQGQSVSGLTLLPFVMVRIASSYMRLFVDLGTELRQVSKSKRRKAIRYGKPLPQETEAIIRRKVLEAVRDYLAH